MNSFEAELEKYNYSLPINLIAQEPAKRRERAKLLIYRKDSRSFDYDIFANLGKYLPKKAVLVFNQTTVIPARLELAKHSGGKVKILYLSHRGNIIETLANRKLALNSIVSLFNHRSKLVQMRVMKKINNHYFLRLLTPAKNPLDIFKTYGQTPLPPYIRHSSLSEQQRKAYYQTVFAKTGLSVAAPTASLHFTEALLAKFKKQGIAIKFVNLNVGLGTFAPLTNDNLKKSKLHSETFEITPATAKSLNQSKKQGRPIIAVGTTVMRTLESAAKNGKLTKLSGSTELFIRPGHRFQIADGLITNFHVPKSSLMMLVASLVGRQELLRIYQKAIHKQFRFFSFGDGMIVLP